ncbi:MAG: flippase [Candidatus Methanofastidiosia archaeon]
MYRKSSYLFVANMANRALNFLLRIVLRAVLGVSGFGTIAVILPIQNMILTVTSYAVSPTVSKFVSEDYEIKKKHDLSPFVFIFVGIIFLVIGIALSKSFADFLSDDFGSEIVNILRVMFCVVPLGILFSIFTGIFFGKRKAKVVAISLFIVQCSSVVFAYFLGMSIGIRGAVISFSIAYVVGIIFVLINFLKEDFDTTFDKSRCLEMIKFSLPMLVTSLAIVAIFQADIVILGRYYSTEQTSVYGLVTPTARLIPSFSIALSSMLLPKLSSLKASNSREKISKTIEKAFEVGFVVSLPFALCIIAFSKEILYVLFYAVEGNYALKILAVGMFCYSMFYLFSSSVQGIGKPGVPMYVLSLCAVLDIVFCFLLIPRYGILGAGTATSLSMIMAFVIMLAYVKPGHIPRLMNLISFLPLFIFEKVVGIVDGRIETIVVYSVVGLIYFAAYIKLNRLYEIFRKGE